MTYNGDDARQSGVGPMRHRTPLPGAQGASSWSRGSTPLPVLPVVGGADVAQHCWEIVQSPDNNLHGSCEECYAYFVKQDCWTLWGLRPAGHKPCCQKREDCATCPVLINQVAPQPTETVQVRPTAPIKPPPPRPNGARQVCRYLEVSDLSTSPDSPHYISAVSRAVQIRSSSFRCRLRGVHLDIGYTSDMCVSRHVQDCAFLDEAHPEVSVHGPTTRDGMESLKEPRDMEARTPNEMLRQGL